MQLRPGREVTHWTQAGPGNQHDSTVPIVVEEVIKDDAGKVLLQQKADLGDVGDGTKAFIFKVLLLSWLLHYLLCILEVPQDILCH